MSAIILTSPLQGWACAMDEVPDPVFAGRMLGDGMAVDPLAGMLYAPCDGEVLTLHASLHAVTLRGEAGVEILMHVGVDTVALGGAGFDPLVGVGDQVKRGQPLLRFDLDRVAMTVPSLMTPIVITNGDSFTIRSRAASGLVEVGDSLLVLEPVAAGTPVVSVQPGDRVSRRVRVPLPHGIHARPAARIGEAAKSHAAASWVVKDGVEASTRSAIALLQLGVRLGDEIEVFACGDDADQAVDSIVALIAGGMGETEGHGDAPVQVQTASSLIDPIVVPEGALTGTMAAQGYCIGHARWLRAVDLPLPQDGQGVKTETLRLEQGIAALSARLQEGSDEDSAKAAICRAHLACIDDPALRQDALRQISEGREAGYAWRQACRTVAATMRTMNDARFAERADDLIDLERQMLRLLTGVAEEATRFPPNTILLANELMPSQVMALDENVVGIALEGGGPTSHVAILAASMGLPALVALGAPLKDVANGATLILDAGAGLLHVDPSIEALAAATVVVEQRNTGRVQAIAAAAESCFSRDGVRIEAFANLASLEEATIAMAHGAEGSGLLRTEMLFLDRGKAPTISEQTDLYASIAQTLDGRPLIIRLLDIGGDKPAPYLPIAPEENPALGLRGIRVGLAMPDILDDQIRAILSVRPHGQCRIMVPMVASVAELARVRSRVEAIGRELGVQSPVEVGIMIETPAAAVTAGTLARHADFLSIGTNDLTQYALAMDRGNPAVASGIDGLHPAVLQLIALTTQGAARHRRWVGVCGGLASDALAIPLLLGLGVTELSATPRFVPDLKMLVRRLSVADCRAHAERALALESAAEVRALAREFEKDLSR